MSDFHTDPAAVLDEMERRLVEARLLKETFRAGGNGSKTAAKKLRKVTYLIGVLGKHFRDLSNTPDAAKRKTVVANFGTKWAKLIAPTRRKPAKGKTETSAE